MRPSARTCLLASALLVLGYVLIRTAWLSDDAYITFRAVENFVGGLGPRWNPAERVQAFTHALWFFLLAGFRAATGEIYLTSIGLSIGMTLVAAAIILGRVAVSTAAVAFAAVALLSSRAFVDYSTSGLENPLSNLLLAVFVAVWSRDEGRPSARRLTTLTAIAALLMTNRLDTGLLVIPALIAEVWALGVVKSLVPVLIGSLPFAAWESFSVIYYGFPLPNTVYAKLPPNVAVADLVPHGLAYVLDSLQHDPVTVPVIAAAVLLPAVLKPRRAWPFSVGLILSIAFMIRVGGDFMSGRFFATPFVLAVAVLAQGRWPARPALAWAPAAAVLAAGLFTPFPPVLSTSTFDGRFESEAGITDERRYYFQNSGLIRAAGFSRAVTTRREAAVARVLERGQKVAVTISVGFVGYFAGPRLHIVDSAALADPLLARLPSDVPWRVGHYLRPTPPGYGETLEQGRNLLKDPGLARYYDKLALVTRGPIWSRARWAAILELNLGRAGYLLDGYALGDTGALAADLLGPKPAGSPSEPATFVPVLRLYLDQPRRMRQVEFSLDATHDYRTVYLRRGKELYTEFMRAPAPDGGAGFVEHRQTLPDSIGEVDQIRVMLRRGRGLGRLAYWRMLE